MPFQPEEPTTRWLSLPSQNDRDMQLLDDFAFIDAQGRQWHAPRQSVINGASIPSALWTTVGSPYTGAYRRASIVHDVACVQARTDDDRYKADRMFYEASLEGGCSTRQANLLYIGVRIGAWWSPPSSLTPTAAGVIRESLISKGPQTDRSVDVFQSVQKKLGSKIDRATPEMIDRLVQAEVSKAKLTEALALDATSRRKKKAAPKQPSRKLQRKPVKTAAKKKSAQKPSGKR